MKIMINTTKNSTLRFLQHGTIREVARKVGKSTAQNLDEVCEKIPTAVIDNTIKFKYGQVDTSITENNIQVNIELNDQFVEDCIDFVLNLARPFVSMCISAYYKTFPFITVTKTMVEGFKSQAELLMNKWGPDSYQYRVYRITGLDKEYAAITKHDCYGNHVRSEFSANNREFTRVLSKLIDSKAACCNMLLDTTDEAVAISAYNELKNEVDAKNEAAANPETTENGVKANPEESAK